MDISTLNVLISSGMAIVCTFGALGIRSQAKATRDNGLEINKVKELIMNMPKEYVLKSDCVEKMKTERTLTDKAHDRNKNLIIKSEKTGLDLYAALSQRVTNNSEKLVFEEGRKVNKKNGMG